MKTKKNNYIEVSEENQGKLEKAFKCGPKMIYLALTYSRDSELAQKIRHTAIREFGGRIMVSVPKCETFFNKTDDGRDLMVQHFDNGVKLEADKKTGDVVIFDRRGQEIGRWKNVKVSELRALQEVAQSF